MKYILSLFLLGTILAISGLKPDIPGEYEIAKWYGFKKATITYSFDDNTPNQLPIAVPLFDKYKVKATWNLIVGELEDKDWDGWKKVGKNGHELASHTVNHPRFVDIDDDEQEQELKDSKAAIKKHTGIDPITFVYPECELGNSKIVAKYYISARSCSGELISGNPKDMFDLSSIVVGTEGEDAFDAEGMNKHADEALNKGKWLVFLLHSVDKGDDVWSPIDSAEIESHLIYVKEIGDFWLATFKDVSKYLYEANSLIIDESETDDGYKLKVSCSYKTDLTTMDQPVTVSREVDWKKATLTCGDDETELKAKDGKVIFDVVPGKTYTLTEA